MYRRDENKGHWLPQTGYEVADQNKNRDNKKFKQDIHNDQPHALEVKKLIQVSKHHNS